MNYSYQISMYNNGTSILWLLQAIVVSIIMDSIQQATCTKCISTGADL
jgi:hypothetical protein